MNIIVSMEDVVGVIRSFCEINDDDTNALLLAVGGQLLDISSDEMAELVCAD